MLLVYVLYKQGKEMYNYFGKLSGWYNISFDPDIDIISITYVDKNAVYFKPKKAGRN